MRNRIYNYYVLSLNFNGKGKGFAIGFDSEYLARIFSIYCLLGTGDIVPDYYLEKYYPEYYHSKIAKTL